MANGFSQTWGTHRIPAFGRGSHISVNSRPPELPNETLSYGCGGGKETQTNKKPPQNG